MPNFGSYNAMRVEGAIVGAFLRVYLILSHTQTCRAEEEVNEFYKFLRSNCLKR